MSAICMLSCLNHKRGSLQGAKIETLLGYIFFLNFANKEIMIEQNLSYLIKKFNVFTKMKVVVLKGVLNAKIIGIISLYIGSKVA